MRAASTFQSANEIRGTAYDNGAAPSARVDSTGRPREQGMEASRAGPIRGTDDVLTELERLSTWEISYAPPRKVAPFARLRTSLALLAGWFVAKRPERLFRP